MIDDWEKNKQKMSSKIKERVRKGVPNELRAKVWALLTDGRSRLLQNKGRYAELQGMEDQISEDIREVIRKDLHRTLPNHSMFKESEAGQQMLKRILSSYAVMDPEVGYVQGMGFIAAILLVTGMEEEQVFWTFERLMQGEKYHMHNLYLPGFPELCKMQHELDGLTKKFLPKLHQHFENEGVQSAHLASQWFLTLYVYQFPNHPYLLMRILDAFMSEGWKIMFRVALTLFKLEQDTLLKMDLELIYPHLKNLQADKEPDAFVKAMLKLHLKTKDIEKYGVQYDKQGAGAAPK
ncbi:Ecotropic viral integration site 5-like protein [Diplonema papillatum]|nr:Ecotropic viral integration site 5-like protein [Diplonema papillatum]